MVISLGREGLMTYVRRQLDYFFPDGDKAPSEEQLRSGFDLALERLEFCFSRINPRLPFQVDGGAVMNHLHSDSYCMFLYWFANSMFQLYGESPFCSKLMLLNRALHSIFISYKCEMPSLFLMSHAVGSVIGNAKFEDGLVIFQNVTVNTSDKPINGSKPVLGRYCFLGSGAKIIGSPRIGDFVTVGVNACINNFDVPDRSIVYIDRGTGKPVIKPMANEQALRYAASYFVAGE